MSLLNSLIWAGLLSSTSPVMQTVSSDMVDSSGGDRLSFTGINLTGAVLQASPDNSTWRDMTSNVASPAALSAVVDGQGLAMPLFAGQKCVENAGPITNFVSNAAGSIGVYFYANKAVTSEAYNAKYQEPALFADGNGNLSLTFSAGGLSISSYDGSTWNCQSVPCGIADFHYVQARWNSTVKEIRVDGGAWVTITHSVGGLTAGLVSIGKNFRPVGNAAAQYFDGWIGHVMTESARWSDSEANQLVTYINTKFGKNFGGQGTSVYNPATRSLTCWLERENFSGNTWNGSASAGTSSVNAFSQATAPALLRGTPYVGTIYVRARIGAVYSNVAQIEAWSPLADPTCTLLYDGKETSYNATTGEWVPRYSVIPAAKSISLVGGANHPSDGSGGVYFDGDITTEAGLKDNVGWTSYLGTQVGSQRPGTAFSVHSSFTTYADTSANYASVPYAAPSVVGNSTQGTIGIENIVIDGVHCLGGHVYGSEGYKGVYVPMSTTGMHTAVLRWTASSASGGYVHLSLDGSTSGNGFMGVPVVSEGSTTINYLGIITLGDAYPASSPSYQYFKGTLKAWGILSSAASDTFITKFNRWSIARGFKAGPTVNIATPILTSLNVAQADTAGGDKYLIARGFSLSRVTACEFSSNGGSTWVPGTIGNVATDSVQVIPPAMSATTNGLVRVSGALGVSNTLSLEFWSPLNEASLTSLYERGGYSAGIWTRRGTGTGQFSSSGVSGYINDGAPVLDGSRYLASSVNAFSLVSQSAGAVACVTVPTNETSEGAPAYTNNQIWTKKSSEPFGLWNATDNTNRWFGFHVYDSTAGAYIAVRKNVFSLLRTPHAVVCSFKQANWIRMSVDGSDPSLTSTAMTGNPFYTDNPFNIGANYDDSLNTRGEIRAFCTLNAEPSSTFHTKFYQWSVARHGVGTQAPQLFSIGVDVLSSSGGSGVTAAGANFASIDQCRIGDGATWTTGTASSSSAIAATLTIPAMSPGVYQLQIRSSTNGWSNSIPVYVEATPLVWIAADRATTLANNKVTAIANTAQNGLAVGVSQATSASQPLYQNARTSFAMQPAIVFDGSDDQLVSSVLGTATTGPLTLYLVAEWTGFGNNFVLDDVDGTARLALFDNGASGGQFNAYINGAQFSGGAIYAGVPSVWTIAMNGASSAIYQNDPATPVATGAFPTASVKSLRIGRHTSGTYFFTGAFGLVAIFSGLHDAATRTRTMNRLKAKYGIT